MKVLNQERHPSQFFSSLKQSQSRTLLLDYDGTLAPFKVKRDKAFPYPGVVEVLKQIIEQGATRLVVVSGRRAEELIALLGLRQPPEIWGSHGGERLLPDGTYQKGTLSRQDRRALEATAAWMAEMGWGPHLERKPFGLALHWRGMKNQEKRKMQEKALGHVPLLVAGTSLCLQAFDGGLELRPPGITKGEVVETILAEMQMDTVAAYLGDDLTDEDAFTALKTHSPRGLGVLVREEFKKTKADLWLRPPDELLDFFRRWQKATL
ncbi:MAG: trehalose-phosphatase [Thermodesulfobacteriota bacterium]|nr:trehalose-phosphatase [Thermodesulfobacteriota bacterium]